MFEGPPAPRPENWHARRTVKLRQMALELRTAAARRPPSLANILRQRAVELERSANRMEDLISRRA